MKGRIDLKGAHSMENHLFLKVDSIDEWGFR